jgi:GNAT superfamily N-acetyltransferase
LKNNRIKIIESEILDLKEKENFIEQYVNLRNNYTKLLLTCPVNVFETKLWIRKPYVEIRGIVQNNILLGVVILYLNRNGEITFFVKYQNKGLGGRLLDIIEDVSKKKKLKNIWGWVLKDNLVAQRAFEKKGFTREGMSKKVYEGTLREGFRYKKFL